MSTQTSVIIIIALVTQPTVAVDAADQSKSVKPSSTRGYHHSFSHAEHWAKVFDDPARDVWQKPDQVISSLKLQHTDKIADIGAGTGYFSVRLAKVVPEGDVYAADTETDMVKYLHQLAKGKALANLIPINAKPNDPKLPQKVNLVLIVDTFHHIDSRVEYLKHLKRYLLPESRLIVIDFNQSSKIGPPPHHRLPKENVIQELNLAGYSLVEDLDFLPNQYFLIFRATTKS